MKKLMIITWDIFPSSSGSGVTIDNMVRYFDPKECVVVGESKGTIENKRDNHYYLSPLFRNIPRLGKYLKWFSFLFSYYKLARIQKKEQCSSILVLFPDEFYLSLALRLSKRKGIDLNLWFHNTYQENRKGILKRLSNYLEPKFLSRSKINFTISDGLTRFYKKKYPQYEFDTLKHGFEVEPPKKKTKKEVSADKLNFLYSGTLNDSCMDASIRLCKAVLGNENWHLHVFGKNERTFRARGVEGDNVHFYGFVDEDTFYNKVMESDIVFIPLGLTGNLSNVEYETIFPTRTIPMLMLGKALLAHAPANSFLSEFLKEHKCAAVVNTASDSDIRDAIHKIAEDASYREVLESTALEVGKRFHSKIIVGELKEKLGL